MTCSLDGVWHENMVHVHVEYFLYTYAEEGFRIALVFEATAAKNREVKGQTWLSMPH